MNKAAQDVLAERDRQIEREGWTPKHDDKHTDGSLATAAACYAHHAAAYQRVASNVGLKAYRECRTDFWPWRWAAKWWKPKDPRRDLVRAGALILAEIERLDRASPPQDKPTGESIRALDRANIDERFNGNERIGEADRRVRDGGDWTQRTGAAGEYESLHRTGPATRRKPQGGE